MKRFTTILTLVAALAFIAAAPPGAYAESPVTFSGYLRIRTIAMGNFFPDQGNASERYREMDKVGDRYAVSRLRLNVVFKPNDNLEIRWRAQGPSAARFGTTNSRTDSTLYSTYFYGLVKTDWGNLSVGRISSNFDSAGLQTLGYLPSWGFSAYGLIFDRDSENDGIMYTNEWDNGFGLKAIYMKRAHLVPNAIAGEFNADADYDRMSIEPYYKWDTGAASLALQYDRNMYNFASNGIDIGAVDTNVQENYLVSINPALIQSWKLSDDKSVTLHAEAKYSFGHRKAGPIDGVEQRSIKQEGFGAYVDFTLGYPQGTASLAGWYFTGNDSGPGYVQGSNWKDRGMVNPGEGFYPFIMFYYGTYSFVGGATNLEGFQRPGHWALAILGNHKLNDYLTLNYGLGTFRKTSDYYITPTSKASRSLGNEVNLGVTVKILDNLTWQSKLGLFDAGDYYSDRYDRPDFDRTLWGWANEFLFSF
ncbi:MAG: porin [Deltaproteobacteria bacterium]|jgi:hypothetical protein|nr:porin [Deltaproteobacteria bacterium]